MRASQQDEPKPKEGHKALCFKKRKKKEQKIKQPSCTQPTSAVGAGAGARRTQRSGAAQSRRGRGTNPAPGGTERGTKRNSHVLHPSSHILHPPDLPPTEAWSSFPHPAPRTPAAHNPSAPRRTTRCRGPGERWLYF